MNGSLLKQSLNPATLWVAGFDWFGRSSRLAYGLVLLAMAVCVVLFRFSIGAATLPPALAVAAILGTALLFVPMIGHTLRRLNDLGWSGWWFWLLVVPVLGLVFQLMLCIRRGRPAARSSGSGLRLAGMVLSCLGAVTIALRVIWEPYVILSGAMSPTLLNGDLALANRLVSDFARGDVIVFRHPVTGHPVIMRLIGLPGDHIQMQDGMLVINGAPVQVVPDGTFEEVYRKQGPVGIYPQCANGAVGTGAICIKEQAQETLPGGATHAILNIGNRALDNTGEYVVPEDHVFVMGDNRDNATDSRVAPAAGGVGFVSRDNLLSRVDRVLFSSAGASMLAVWDWRAGRYLRAIR